MRRIRWFAPLLTLALLAILAFVTGVITGGSFLSYFAVALLSWLLIFGVQRAFRDDTGRFDDMDGQIREGRTDAARLQSNYGRMPDQPGGV